MLSSYHQRIWSSGSKNNLVHVLTISYSVAVSKLMEVERYNQRKISYKITANTKIIWIVIWLWTWSSNNPIIKTVRSTDRHIGINMILPLQIYGLEHITQSFSQYDFYLLNPSSESLQKSFLCSSLWIVITVTSSVFLFHVPKILEFRM